MSVTKKDVERSLGKLSPADRQQAYTAQIKMMVWALCAFRNYPYIEMDFMKQRDPPPDLERYRFRHNPYAGKPAIIIGSGPSLDESVPYLKNWEGPIFCGPTHSQILKANGIEPTFIGIFDSQNTPENMGLPLVEYPETILLSHPLVNPDINMMWKWTKLYFILVSGADDMWDNMALSFEDFVKLKRPSKNSLLMDLIPNPIDHMDELLKIVYNRNPILKGGMGHMIRRAGCVVNELAIIASQSLKCDPIFLVGVDNAFTGGKYRATGYAYDGKRFRRRAAPMIQDLPDETLPGFMERKGLPTLSQFWSYHRALVTISRMVSEDTVMNPIFAGKSFGLYEPFPTADIEEVVKCQGLGYPGITAEQAVARAKDWHARNPWEGES